MDNLYCNGLEPSLTECPFDGWGVHDCGSEEAAGVKCIVQKPKPEIAPIVAPETNDVIIIDIVNITWRPETLRVSNV